MTAVSRVPSSFKRYTKSSGKLFSQPIKIASNCFPFGNCKENIQISFGNDSIKSLEKLPVVWLLQSSHGPNDI